MKIGFVLDDSLDKSDGVQQYILTLGHYFHHAGHEVHYLVGQTERKDLAHVHSLSKNLQVHFNQNRMSTPLPANKPAISELLQTEQFDVLHVQMPYSPFLAGRIIRLAPSYTAVIGTFHVVPFSPLEAKATKLLGLYLRRNLKRLDALVSVSRPAQIFAKRAWRIKSTIVPNAVKLAEFHTGKMINKFDDGKLNIVFLGRLVERKGCMHLLEALNQLNQQGLLENVRVLVCGKGPLEAELKSYVEKYRLKRIVHFVGYISEQLKPNYLASADIAVFPSTGGESFGIVLIEAMAAGARTVLGGANVGYSSVLGGAPKQLFNPEDTDEFAKTLKHYILSGVSRKKTSVWQTKQVQQYDVAQVGAQLMAIYQSALVKRRNKSDNIAHEHKT